MITLHNISTFRKNTFMIDIKSKLVLSILAKESVDGSYKIVEISDIIMALPKHFRMDSDAIKHILTHLERQDIISIKYDDEDIYCLAVLPYGYEILESEKPIKIRKQQPKNTKSWINIALCFVSALFGCIIGVIICYFLLKIL